MPEQAAPAFPANKTFEEYLQEHGLIPQPVFERLREELAKNNPEIGRAHV